MDNILWMSLPEVSLCKEVTRPSNDFIPVVVARTRTPELLQKDQCPK